MAPSAACRASAAGLLAAALLGGPLAASAAAAPLRLPTPAEARQSAADLLLAVEARPDRGLVSRVPGPADNDEHVLVRLGGDGLPRTVQVEQRVVLQGTGDFQVRERGPARAAVSLSEESAPVTKFGAVVWQGFTTGDPPRELAALLTLDPQLEQPRLPMTVRTSFTPAGGLPEPLQPGGRVPAAGTVLVEVANQTAQPADLPTALDAAPGAVARALDAAVEAAAVTEPVRLPTTRAGLPAQVDVRRPGVRPGSASVPLRLTGQLLVSGTTASVSGGGTSPVPGGAVVRGTLQDAPARFEVAVDGPGELALDLTAVPALDPRTLAPPDAAASWREWAAGRPGAEARRAALDLLVQVAATGARATSFSPYLGADLPGTGRTRFTYSFAPVEQVVAVRAPLEPRPVALALSGLAGLLVLGGAVGIWRQA